MVREREKTSCSQHGVAPYTCRFQNGQDKVTICPKAPAGPEGWGRWTLYLQIRTLLDVDHRRHGGESGDGGPKSKEISRERQQEVKRIASSLGRSYYNVGTTISELLARSNGNVFRGPVWVAWRWSQQR